MGSCFLLISFWIFQSHLKKLKELRILSYFSCLVEGYESVSWDSVIDPVCGKSSHWRSIQGPLLALLYSDIIHHHLNVEWSPLP